MPSTSGNELDLWVWIGCFGISLTCLLVGALTLLLPGPNSSWLGRYGRTIAMLLAAAIFAADSVAWMESRTEPATRFLLQVALLLVGAGCYVWLGWAAARKPGLAPLALLIGGVLLGGWLTWRLVHDSHGVVARHNAFAAATDSVWLVRASAAERLHALTDAGRPVRLFAPCAKVGALDDVCAQLAAHQGPFPYANRVMIAAPLDLTHNCGGWVFAGGRFVIKPDDFERIIEDNEYVPVERPAAGDLILYRNDTGMMIHVGIVKATGVDGYVLIESKWGWIGQRVVHPPDLQPYSQRYDYYRSPRGRHLLRGLEYTDLARR